MRWCRIAAATHRADRPLTRSGDLWRCRGVVRLGRMDLEEKTLEKLGDRCEECGAKLTPAELQAAMESGGPALCSIHAAEDEPGLAASDEAAFGEDA